uniref:Putative conserved secreted protein n=1 Tax=Ixodes scapularis TaxID=6945 RepID=A0A4D5S3Z3_IXOSC
MKLLLVLAALVAVATGHIVERRTIKNPDGSTTLMESSSWGDSHFNQENNDDGIITGRMGYVDSAGTSIERHYEAGRDGKRRFIDAKDSKLKGPPPSFNFGPMPNPTDFGVGLYDDFLAGRSGFGNLRGFRCLTAFGDLPGFGAAARRVARY